MEAICVFAIYWCRVCGPGVQPNFLINKLSAISANHLLSLFGANHLSTHWFIPNSCQSYINCFETFGKKYNFFILGNNHFCCWSLNLICYNIVFADDINAST